MKNILSIFLSFAIIANLSGCAYTRLYSPSGQKILDTQANFDKLAYTGGLRPTLYIEKGNHSLTTATVGRVITNTVTAVGTAATGLRAVPILQ